MKRYIALLRGINISGKNKVPMVNRKKFFEALGFSAFAIVILHLQILQEERYLRTPSAHRIRSIAATYFGIWAENKDLSRMNL